MTVTNSKRLKTENLIFPTFTAHKNIKYFVKLKIINIYIINVPCILYR